MFFVLSKILGVFLIPSNLIGLMAAAGLLFLLFRRLKTGGAFLAFAAAALLIAGWLPVGSAALLALENRFPQPQLHDVTGIVVLGGGVDTIVSSERQTATVTDAGDRLTKAAELSLLYPQARILLAGGLGDLTLAGGKTESALARDFLIQIGVPGDRIEIEERSRNTCENATESKVLARPQPGEVWLLVTSAYHMPRAVACFRAAGFPIIPYPVDYLIRRTALTRPTIPISLGLTATDLAAHEWAGLVAYRLAKGTELFPAPR